MAYVYLVRIDRKTKFPQYMTNLRSRLGKGRGWTFVKITAERFPTREAAEAEAFKIVMSNPGDLVGKVDVVRWSGGSGGTK